MTLGEKLKQARTEAGLSQRQLCGDTITRNMLSQIENGSAQPSMGTLSVLAARLGKTVSFFLEEDALDSPNLNVMTAARQALADKKWADVLDALRNYREPDEVFCRERQLLETLVTLELAEEALAQGKTRYAVQLLEEMNIDEAHYCGKELNRRKLLLLGSAEPERMGNLMCGLPSLDEELMLRAMAALEQKKTDRSGALLDAVEHRNVKWQYLRGCVYLEAGQFTKAAACLLKAERELPGDCFPKLERCYRELGNYEKAYHYACKQRDM